MINGEPRQISGQGTFSRAKNSNVSKTRNTPSRSLVPKWLRNASTRECYPRTASCEVAKRERFLDQSSRGFRGKHPDNLSRRGFRIWPDIRRIWPANSHIQLHVRLSSSVLHGL
jgi:hypothetical protein